MQESKSDIILVDDNKENSLLISRYLEKNKGFLLFSSHQNALVSLSRIKVSKPKLVIINLTSNSFEPFSLLKNIRGTDKISNTPVVGLVSSDSPDLIQKAKSFGVKAFSSTPVSIKDLSQKIAEPLKIELDPKKQCRIEANVTNNIMIIEVQGQLLLEDLLDHTVNIKKGFGMFDENTNKKALVIFYDIDMSTLTQDNIDLLFDFYESVPIEKPEFVKILANNNEIIAELKKNKKTKKLELAKDYMDGINKLELAAINQELGVKIDFLSPGTKLVGDIYDFSGRRIKKAYEILTEDDIDGFRSQNIDRVFYEKDLEKFNQLVENSENLDDVKMKRVFDALNPENVKKIVQQKTGPFSFLYDKNILIIDDEESILDMLSHFLAQKGFKVYTAADSRRGLELAAEKNPDLIITDIMMPFFSGHDFMSAMNKKFGDQRPPIIMITSAPTGENVKKARLSGVNGFIPKPIDFQTLFVKVAKELKKYQQKIKS